MSYKEAIDRVRSQMTEEQISKVGADLKVIESEIIERDNELTATRSEAKDKRLKLNDAKSKIADLETEVETLQKQTDTTELKKQIEGLKAKNTKLIGGLKSHFQAQHEFIATHPNYENAVSWFDIPKKEDGALDYESMTEEQVEKNFDAINKLNQIKFFGDVKKGSVNDGKGKTGDGPANLEKMDAELWELRRKSGPTSKQYQDALAKFMEAKKQQGV